MDEFLEKLLSQIRCKKARPYIKDEIKMHIEEQISDNIRSGMIEEEAVREAVKDMGDPIEIGISLDRIHKPQIAWRMLAIIALISILGVVLHLSISFKMNKYGLSAASNGSLEFAFSVFIGIVVMLALYFIDYTTIGKYSRLIGGVMIAAAIYASLFGVVVAGRTMYIGLGSLRVQTTALMMFYVPVYGAILYKYRGGGLAAFAKALLWMLVPVVLVFRFPSIVIAAIMLISMLVQLTIALSKGWFKVPVKSTIALLWVLAITSLIIYLSRGLLEYQAVRLREFFLGTGDSLWLTHLLRDLSDVAVIGGSNKEVIGYLPDFNRDYIFSYVLNTYGILAGVLLIGVLAALVLSIFSTAINQKNQLGCVMGCGCGMILLMNITINLLVCIGIVPVTSCFLPFFSAGGSNIVLSYALVGIALSIYRYKNVYPQHVSTKLVLKKMSVE